MTIADLVPRKNRWVLHRPHPKQAALLALDHVEEVLFGGQAGGGKTDAQLMCGLAYVDVPGYQAGIFRRAHTHLVQAGGLIPRSHEWLQGTGAEWNGNELRWTFPSSATLTFGSIFHEEDKYKWKGSEFAYLGFEEASEFTGTQMDYLLSRLRRTVDGRLGQVPLRARYTSNPGGPGHEFLKARFIGQPGARLRPTLKRAFLPSSLADNPSLGPEYAERLNALTDPIERARLAHGDWDASGGGLVFDRSWFEIVDSVPLDVKLRRVRGWDMAATAGGGCETAGAKVAKSPGGVYYFEDLIAGQWDTGARNQVMLQTARTDGSDVEVDWEQEPGSSGKDATYAFTRMLQGFRTWGTPASGDKVVRAGTWAGQAKVGNMKVVRGPWNQLFLDAVQRFPEAFLDRIDACTVAFKRLSQGWDGTLFR